MTGRGRVKFDNNITMVSNNLCTAFNLVRISLYYVTSFFKYCFQYCLHFIYILHLHFTFYFGLKRYFEITDKESKIMDVYCHNILQHRLLTYFVVMKEA